MVKNSCMCGSKNHVPFIKTDRFSAVKCENCSLVYVNKKISIKKQKDYFSLNDVNKVENCYKDFRFKYYEKAMRFLDLLKPEKGRLLDVGASFGWFVHSAHKHGWKVNGIEPSKIGVKKMGEVYNYKVFNKSSDYLKYIDRKYDVISFWNVLEHLKNPKLTLKLVRKKLKKYGIVVVVVPNLDGLITKLILHTYKIFNGIFKKDIDNLYQSKNEFMHLYHFNEQSLSRLLEDVGFHILKVEKQDIIDTNKIMERLELDYNKSWLNYVRSVVLKILTRVSRNLNMQDELVIYAVRDKN